MISDRIDYLVQWSKQFNVKGEEYYSVAVKSWTGRLPHWAAAKIGDFYQHKLPQELLSIIPVLDESISKTVIDNESKEHFLQTDLCWITYVERPEMFQSQSSRITNDITKLETVIVDCMKESEKIDRQALELNKKIEETWTSIEALPKGQQAIENDVVNELYEQQKELQGSLAYIRFRSSIAKERCAQLKKKIMALNTSVSEISTPLTSRGFSSRSPHNETLLISFKSKNEKSDAVKPRLHRSHSLP